MKPKRVLLVDDSCTARAALRLALSQEPTLEVVGEAADGGAARRLIAQLSPDLITMDLFLRAESGLQLAASIMAVMATPIVVVTAADASDPTLAFRAMQAGVLEVCSKLPAPTHVDYDKRRARLLRVLRTLAHVPVVHRGSLAVRRAHLPPEPWLTHPTGRSSEGTKGVGTLLLGASTGGPPVLSRLLRALPRPFPWSIALVQHMIPDFVAGFAKWLGEDTERPVSVVESTCAMQGDSVYVAPANHHLVLHPGGRIGLSREGGTHAYRPSVDVLFESAARCPGSVRSIGVLLTGMGADGARGLLALRRAGARTMVQDPLSCTVQSMPANAIALGAADVVLPVEALARAICEEVRRLNDSEG